MLFETSQDILYITVSVCALAFTIFLCWMLYYLTQLLKQSNQITQELHTKISEWTEAIDEIKERVMSTASTLSSLGDQVGRVVDFVNKRRDSRREDEDLEEKIERVVEAKKGKRGNR